MTVLSQRRIRRVPQHQNSIAFSMSLPSRTPRAQARTRLQTLRFLVSEPNRTPRAIPYCWSITMASARIRRSFLRRTRQKFRKMAPERFAMTGAIAASSSLFANMAGAPNSRRLTREKARIGVGDDEQQRKQQEQDSDGDPCRRQPKRLLLRLRAFCIEQFTKQFKALES